MTGKLLLLEQTREDTQKWKRLLDCLQQNNIVQKYHLAELLKQYQGKDDFVPLAEHYQNRFLQQDEALKLMRNDVAILEELCITNQRDQIYHRKKKFEKELRVLRANFKQISSEFAIFVLSAASLCV